MSGQTIRYRARKALYLVHSGRPAGHKVVRSLYSDLAASRKRDATRHDVNKLRSATSLSASNALAFDWCGREDLNLHGVSPTTTSR